TRATHWRATILAPMGTTTIPPAGAMSGAQRNLLRSAAERAFRELRLGLSLWGLLLAGATGAMPAAAQTTDGGTQNAPVTGGAGHINPASGIPRRAVHRQRQLCAFAAEICRDHDPGRGRISFGRHAEASGRSDRPGERQHLLAKLQLEFEPTLRDALRERFWN